jgi:hypothetical protein
VTVERGSRIEAVRPVAGPKCFSTSLRCGASFGAAAYSDCVTRGKSREMPPGQDGQPELHDVYVISVFLRLAVVLSVVNGTAVATEYVSTEPAQQLAYFFDRTGLNALAAVDPAEPGAFAAALHVAGDLLVVRARHPDAQAVRARLKEARFFQIYLDLIATPTPAGKLFVMDAGANGVLSGVTGAENIDLIREEGGRQIAFNGDFSGQRMSAAQYDAKLAHINAEYARILKLLLSSVQSP